MGQLLGVANIQVVSTLKVMPIPSFSHTKIQELNLLHYPKL